MPAHVSRRVARWATACAALAAALLSSACVGVSAPGPSATPVAAARPAPALTLAVIGDMPYAPNEVGVVDQLLAQIDADPTVDLVLHVGDLKGGSESCDDALLAARARQLQVLRKPWLYTPGDNEWTDCHRAAAGRFVPLERLQKLRGLLHGEPRRSGGAQPLPLQTQGDMPGHQAFVENASTMTAGVLVATLHLVGSRNDLEPWMGLDPTDSAATPRADRMAAFQARERANLAWIDRVVERATQENARALVIAFQANPGLEARPGARARIGFEPVLRRLRERAAAFGRPVLLVHGDFHTLIVDQPWRSADHGEPAVPALTRVQTFGSPLLRWVRVRIDPADAQQPFRIEPRGLDSGR